MKLTRPARRTNGLTYPEIGVVVLVLLSMVGILFVGFRSKLEASDRAANIMNIRNVQQAMRAYQGMKGLMVGDACPTSGIFGDGLKVGFMKQPVPPTTGLDYRYLGKVPGVGELYLQVSGPAAARYAPAAGQYADW